MVECVRANLCSLYCVRPERNLWDSILEQTSHTKMVISYTNNWYTRIRIIGIPEQLLCDRIRKISCDLHCITVFETKIRMR